MTGSPHGGGSIAGPGRTCNPLASVWGRLLARGCLIPLLVLLWVPVPLVGQARNDMEVKAAFVYNLTKYVEWPEPANRLLIGVVGDGPMGPILKQMIAGKKSDTRTIEVLTLSPSDPAVARCQVLFISFRSSKKNKEVLEKVRRAGILTVSDSDPFAGEGGMIGLVTVEDHVQIQVNLEMVNEARLKVSSRLLQLATLVHNKPGAGN
jgi:hypothetical protein